MDMNMEAPLDMFCRVGNHVLDGIVQPFSLELEAFKHLCGLLYFKYNFSMKTSLQIDSIHLLSYTNSLQTEPDQVPVWPKEMRS
jgi:hypothetical protein